MTIPLILQKMLVVMLIVGMAAAIVNLICLTIGFLLDLYKQIQETKDKRVLPKNVEDSSLPHNKRMEATTEARRSRR